LSNNQITFLANDLTRLTSLQELKYQRKQIWFHSIKFGIISNKFWSNSFYW
jgi:hypothetical protein